MFFGVKKNLNLMEKSCVQRSVNKNFSKNKNKKEAANVSNKNIMEKTSCINRKRLTFLIVYAYKTERRD